MLYSQRKEREYRFALALRMGTPILLLTLIPLFIFFNTILYEITQSTVEVVSMLFMVSIYFIFYLIYKGNEGEITDSLTHTFTRERFIREVERLTKEKSRISIALISIENFDEINEHYGYERGENILSILVKTLDNMLTEKGYVETPISRYQGATFLFGLKEDIEKAKLLLERAVLSLNESIIGDIEIRVRGRVVDISNRDSIKNSIHRLFDQYSGSMALQNLAQSDVTQEDYLALNERVIRAIEKGSFDFRFQPVVDRGGRSVMVECSIKLIDSDGGIIHQKDYIKAIGRLGVERDFWILAIEKIAHRLMEHKISLQVAITISPLLLRNRLFAKELKELISRYPNLKEHLIFIFSESKVYSNMERFSKIVKSYQSVGIRVALDNVGVLNASVEYIKRIPVDMIRLDKSFVRHLEERRYTMPFEALIASAKTMNIVSWVKMVESKEQLEKLEKSSVEYFQGIAVGEVAELSRVKEQYEIW